MKASAGCTYNNMLPFTSSQTSNGVRFSLALLLLFVFSGMALLGFLGIICKGGVQFCCLANIMQGVLCSHDGSIASANSHVGFLKDFSKATFGAGFSALMALVGIVFLVLAYQAREISPVGLRVISRQERRRRRSFAHLWRKQFTRWLMLHEVSPSLA